MKSSRTGEKFTSDDDIRIAKEEKNFEFDILEICHNDATDCVHVIRTQLQEVLDSQEDGEFSDVLVNESLKPVYVLYQGALDQLCMTRQTVALESIAKSLERIARK